LVSDLLGWQRPEPSSHRLPPLSTERVKGLTDDELRELVVIRDRLDELDCEHDVRHFVRRYSPEFQDPVHLDEIAEVLDASMSESVFALIEAPPRRGKTELIMHGMARRLKFRPTENVIYVSYAAPLALRKSRRTRELAARAGVWVGAEAMRVQGEGTDQRFDPSKAVSYWQTAEGGAFIAGGRGGSYVGDGGHLIVLDDPFKNRTEAESDKVSDAVYEDLFQGTLFTRREPNGSVIVTHQPWNDRDLIARLVEWAQQMGIRNVVHVRLPAVKNAVYDRDGLISGGEPMWAERHSLESVRETQQVIGSYNFESQYMCNRVPRGSRVFKEPARYDTAHTGVGCIIATSCDPGIEKDVKKDPSGFVVAAGYVDRQRNVCMDVLIAYEENLEIPGTVDELEELFGEWPGPIIVEEVSAFKSVTQVARRLDEERSKRNEGEARLPIESWVPKTSKLVRALPMAAAVEYGRFRVPRSAPWLDAYLKQLRRMTHKTTKSPNLVDASTQLYDWFCRRLATRAVRGRVGGQSALHGSPY
jgi:hypothetical protein